MDQIKVLQEHNKLLEPNYKICWEAARAFRPHLLIATITTLPEVPPSPPPTQTLLSCN